MLATDYRVTEAAALAGVSERKVRGELERVVGASHSTLGFPTLVYLRVLQCLEDELGAGELGVSLRRRIFQSIAAESEANWVSGSIRVAELMTIALRHTVSEFTAFIEDFKRWEANLTKDPGILGGETVFPGSRLSVRHIGGMLERDESADVILEDYPYLTQKDLEFARIYVRAYPRVGRPRKRKTSS